MAKSRQRQGNAARRMSGPKKKYEPLVRKTVSFIKGKRITADLPRLGIRATSRVWWEEGQEARIDEITFGPMSGLSPREKRLVQILQRDLEAETCDILLPELEDALHQSKAFTNFNEQVKQFCKRLDRMEEEGRSDASTDGGFDFSTDVLDFADRRLGRGYGAQGGV